MSDRSDRVLAAVSQAVPHSLPTVSRDVPEHMRGRLGDAMSDLTKPAPVVGAEAPYSYANVVVRNKTPWKGLRTGAELADNFTAEVQQARTQGQVFHELRQLRDRFMSTGVYRDVQFAEEPAADGSGGRDLVVELDERAYSLSQGATVGVSGNIVSTTDASLLNSLGMGETFSASFRGAAPEGLSQAGLAGLAHGDTSALRRAHISPSFSAAFRKPTVLGFRTPLSVAFRSEVEHHEATLGFSKKVAEVEVSVTDPSNRHSVSYQFGVRNVLPIAHPTSDFLTASSPLVVANSVATSKSSLGYSYAYNTLRGNPTLSKGWRFLFNAELAGLGGDACFAKAEGGLGGMYSLGRYQPDTGYAQPLTKAEHAQAQAARARAHRFQLGGYPHWSEGHSSQQAAGSAAEGRLKPHPGPAVFGVDAPSPFTAAAAGAAAAAEPYSFLHRLAGWLSPGVTLSLEAQAGALRGLGPDARDAACPRLVDRFFLTAQRMRGFHAVGPVAERVEHGSPYGDALGGDVYGVLTARLMLPPPIPSVRLANAGVRTLAYATAGKVGALGDAVAAPLRFGSTATASAGIGVTVPLAHISLEGNWTLWHNAQPGDAAANFRIMMSA